MELKRSIEALEKKYKVRIYRPSDDVSTGAVDVIPTKLAPLDVALGIGGIPLGFFLEVYSPEGVGKTTLCLHIAACAQRLGYNVAYIDMEHRLDHIWASVIGVELGEDGMLIVQPQHGDAALNVTRGLIEAGIKLVIIDSVPALVPKQELEGETGDQFVGLQARMIAQHIRQCNPILKPSGATIIFINQLRARVGGMGSLAYGPRSTTPGGYSIKYYSSMRLDMRRTGTIKEPDGSLIGQNVSVTIQKSSLSVPRKTADLRLLYRSGFNMLDNVIDPAIRVGLIEQNGSWYTLPDGEKVQGRSNLYDSIKEADIFDELYSGVMDVFGVRTNDSKIQGD